MNRKPHMDYLDYEDDAYVNELATDWYFLNMFYNGSDSSYIERVVDPLITVGLRLKRCLREAAHTTFNPRKVCADENLRFYIWLDEVGNIQTGDLYMDEEEE